MNSENTIPCTLKFVVPCELAPRLEALRQPSLDAVRKMLKRRNETSSKFYKTIPCVVAKALMRKYQRNPKCRKISRIVIPICGDKGGQIKQERFGIRIPILFGKVVVPVFFKRPIVGYIRCVEFYKRSGIWTGALCYNTPKADPIKVTGCIGIDRNSVGNIAVFADPKTGTVRKMGICPARTKAVMRGRRKNLQKAGKSRLLSKLRRKQSRRMTHENHRVSKSVVDYAAKHCRAVAIENLKGIYAKKSKIRHYSEKNQWAFAQLENFLRYKCALRGVPIIEVDPAYTSQTCSRCGSRHKPAGKLFSCGTCGRIAHRDVNASFVIAKLGLACIGGGSDDHNVSSLRCLGDAQAGKGNTCKGIETNQNPKPKNLIL